MKSYKYSETKVDDNGQPIRLYRLSKSGGRLSSKQELHKKIELYKGKIEECEAQLREHME